jgi:hypothetical protein
MLDSLSCAARKSAKDYGGSLVEFRWQSRAFKRSCDFTHLVDESPGLGNGARNLAFEKAAKHIFNADARPTPPASTSVSIGPPEKYCATQRACSPAPRDRARATTRR